MTQPCYCGKCGQLIPPKILFRNASVKQRIYDFVSQHPEGVNSVQIADHIYADDPDGGPGSPEVTVRTHIFFMNRLLNQRGVMIRAGSGRYSTYTLRQV